MSLVSIWDRERISFGVCRDSIVMRVIQIFFLCVLQCVSGYGCLILVWATTHSDVCRDWFVCLSWLRKPKTVLWMAMCEFVCRSHSEVSSCTYLNLMWAIAHSDACRDSFICVSWLKNKIGAVNGNVWVCVISRSYVSSCAYLILMWAMTHFGCVPWLVLICVPAVTYLCVYD